MSGPWTRAPARLRAALEIVLGAQLVDGASDARHVNVASALQVYNRYLTAPDNAVPLYAPDGGMPTLHLEREPGALWQDAAARGLLPMDWIDEPTRRFKAWNWYTCPACGHAGRCHPNCNPFVPHPGTAADVVAFLARDPGETLGCEALAREAYPGCPIAVWEFLPSSDWNKDMLLASISRDEAPERYQLLAEHDVWTAVGPTLDSVELATRAFDAGAACEAIRGVWRYRVSRNTGSARTCS